MKLNVYSLKRTIFDGDAKAVNCKTAVGEITVLDHHKPLISVIEAGLLKITDAKNEEHFAEVRSGFLEIQPDNRVRMIVEE